MISPSPSPLPPTRPLRVVIQQPALSDYRVPVFRELARRPGLDILIAYGDESGLRMAKPDGFKGVMVPLQDLGHMSIRYHPAQFRYATRAHADVLILSWSTRYISLFPGLLRARLNGVGTVLWGHGYSKAENPRRRFARNALLRFADAALLYNHRAARALVESDALPAHRAFVALNTLDLSPAQAAAAHWRADHAALARFRDTHTLSRGPVILFVSRLHEANRVDLLLNATPALLARFPDLKVAIVGDGPDAPRLHALAAKLNIQHALRFPGAVYGEENIAPWFLSASVFCYPANIGLSLIHAMSYALPVVTGDAYETQNPEIEAFRDGVNGLSFKAGNVESLTSTLTELLSNPTRRTTLAASAHHTVTQDFTIEKMVDGMEAAIRFAASQHPR